MMKTLFLSDLDGTFLNSSGEISENSRRIISDLVDKGVLFTVATARTHATVMKMFEGINLSSPLVLMNGVTLYDPNKKSIISSKPIPTQLGNKIIAEFTKRGIEPMLYFQHDDTLEIHYSKLTNDYQKEYVAQRTECSGKKFIHSPGLVPIEGKNLVYIVCLDYYENIKDVYTAVSELDNAHCMFYKDNYSDLYFLEIITKTVSKASGAREVKEMLSADQMIAFGDNLNDIPLFEAADEAYAVSNAHEKLKEIATDVIGSNDEDAVARFILDKYNNNEI